MEIFLDRIRLKDSVWKEVLMERRLRDVKDTNLNGVDTALRNAIEPSALRDFRPGYSKLFHPGNEDQRYLSAR